MDKFTPIPIDDQRTRFGFIIDRQRMPPCFICASMSFTALMTTSRTSTGPFDLEGLKKLLKIINGFRHEMNLPACAGNQFFDKGLYSACRCTVPPAGWKYRWKGY